MSPRVIEVRSGAWRTLLFLSAISLAAAVSRPAVAQSAFTQSELAQLSFHQHPGASLPLDAAVVDDTGRAGRLGDYFAGKPVVLVLDYLRCRTLCGFVLSDLARTLAHVPLQAGRDFAVVALSIDPRETAADGHAAKTQYLARYGIATAGWHFLTGAPGAIRRVADVVGFPFRYDAAADQYAHPAGLAIATPDGTIARYILGIDYVPLDLRLGLTEAGHGAIASPVADLLLLCYCYDPVNGRYDVPIGNAMRLAGGVTVLGIIGMLCLLSRPRRGR